MDDIRQPTLPTYRHAVVSPWTPLCSIPPHCPRGDGASRQPPRAMTQRRDSGGARKRRARPGTPGSPTAARSRPRASVIWASHPSVPQVRRPALAPVSFCVCIGVPLAGVAQLSDRAVCTRANQRPSGRGSLRTQWWGKRDKSEAANVASNRVAGWAGRRRDFLRRGAVPFAGRLLGGGPPAPAHGTPMVGPAPATLQVDGQGTPGSRRGRGRNSNSVKMGGHLARLRPWPCPAGAHLGRTDETKRVCRVPTGWAAPDTRSEWPEPRRGAAVGAASRQFG